MISFINNEIKKFSFINFIPLISSLIYLEILELNFCGLNENLKIKIRERGDKEVIYLLLEKIKDSSINSIDKILINN